MGSRPAEAGVNAAAAGSGAGGAAAAARADAPAGARELARLRWRCRRGLLENDLLLARFLDRRGAALTAREIALLDGLLELPDDALLAALCGRAGADAGARAAACALGI